VGDQMIYNTADMQSAASEYQGAASECETLLSHLRGIAEGLFESQQGAARQIRSGAPELTEQASSPIA
jgi:uncharacterized protein YukE